MRSANSKYHHFDPATNIIVPTKYANSNHYAPYQTIKYQSENKSEKKIISANNQNSTQSHNSHHYSPHVNINLKLFDRNKRANHQKILSRNDRIDLYL